MPPHRDTQLSWCPQHCVLAGHLERPITTKAAAHGLAPRLMGITNHHRFNPPMSQAGALLDL
jgi:hypothetical protein